MSITNTIDKYLTEGFIDTDKLLNIIVGIDRSNLDLISKIGTFIFYKSGPQSFNAKTIISQLSKAGLASDEISEVRDVWTECVKVVIDRYISKHKEYTGGIVTNKTSFGVYQLMGDFDFLDRELETLSKLFISKFKSRMSNRKYGV